MKQSKSADAEEKQGDQQKSPVEVWRRKPAPLLMPPEPPISR